VLGYYGRDLVAQARALPPSGAIVRFWVGIILAFFPAAAVGVPRFSPDGKRIAVSLPESSLGRVDEAGPLAWLSPPIAYAHGEPADIWTFDLQGKAGQRLTQLRADDPTPSWSPDGRYLAIWSATGLYLVESTGGTPRQLHDRGGYGTPDWRP
jgi:hypothetical protein